MPVVKNGNVVVNIHEEAIKRLVANGGLINEGVKNAAHTVQSNAKQNIAAGQRVRTGALYNSIIVEPVSLDPMKAHYRVGSTKEYARWQEFGRGPVQGRPILRFRPKGSHKFIFRPYAGPASGIHFMRRALKALRPSDFRAK